MNRRFVNEFSDGDAVDQVFLAAEKQLRTNRNGNLYLQVRLCDKTGSITTMLWNAHQRHFDGFENGDYVHVQGTAQLYNGNMQVLAKQIEKSTDDDIDESDFVTLSDVELESYLENISSTLRAFENPHLRNLADAFLLDEEFMKQFRSAPAGIKNHHAYHGGLAQHVLGLMGLCKAVGTRYPYIDIELLLMGAFVHDVGKIHELTYSPDFGYSTSGQLVGHLIQGVQILDQMIAETERQTGETFPAGLADQLRHMIVSHHGSHEFGSPKLPMTREAILLHYLDSIDARMSQIEKLIDEDPNKESPWTVYHPNLGIKLYKGDLYRSN